MPQGTNRRSFVRQAVAGAARAARGPSRPGGGLRLRMALALLPVDAQHPKRMAVTYGPVVLVRDESPRLAPSEPSGPSTGSAPASRTACIST